MEYYIVSLIISVIIFGIIYSLDKSSNNNYYDDDNNSPPPKKQLFTSNNILLFVIIYIVATVVSYYIFTSSLSLAGFSSIIPVFILNLFKPPAEVPPMINDNDEIDPKILRKINDNIDIGFVPLEKE
jgi:magnesium-transporting ATPase (P-type)